jgi:hypothetical protein
MGPILEAALYKAPTLYVKAGKYGKAIARYRQVCKITVAVQNFKNLRVHFLKSLAK